MKLGILLNTENHLDRLEGIARAALDKGHMVDVFVMDRATRLLTGDVLRSISSLEGLEITYCDFNAMINNVQAKDVPDSIAAGSQYNNARMIRDADRVIVL